VPPDRVREILLALGNEEFRLAAAGTAAHADFPADVPSAAKPEITVLPPSWRRDLTREIDLIEEVARIHGYEAIPEDVGVPMAPLGRERARIGCWNGFAAY